MRKRVPLSAKPSNQPTADDWVKSRQVETEPMRRLTIDVPDSLHRQIKSQCALRGVKMADEIRAVLEKHFSGESGANA